MFSALQTMKGNLMQAKDTGLVGPPDATGLHYLQEAFAHFRQDVGVNINKIVAAVIYDGRGNFTVTILGEAKRRSDEIILLEIYGCERK